MEREDILEQLNEKLVLDNAKGMYIVPISSKDHLLQEAVDHGFTINSDLLEQAAEYERLKSQVDNVILLDVFLWKTIWESHSLSLLSKHDELLGNPLLGHSIYYLLNQYSDLLTQSDGWRLHNLVSEGMIAIIMGDLPADITFFQLLKEMVAEFMTQKSQGQVQYYL